MSDGVRKKDDEDEKVARNNLNRLFGRLAFEKGNAYGREEKEDEITRLGEDAIITRKRIRAKPSTDEAKPPEAYPGP